MLVLTPPRRYAFPSLANQFIHILNLVISRTGITPAAFTIGARCLRRQADLFFRSLHRAAFVAVLPHRPHLTRLSPNSVSLAFSFWSLVFLPPSRRRNLIHREPLLPILRSAHLWQRGRSFAVRTSFSFSSLSLTRRSPDSRHAPLHLHRLRLPSLLVRFRLSRCDEA